MGASSTLKQGGGGAAFERRRAACEVRGCPSAPLSLSVPHACLPDMVHAFATRQLLENYAKAYTREKQAEKERKMVAEANGEVPSSTGSSKKRRKTEKKTVVVPEPLTEAAAKGVALGAAVAAQHPPLGPSPGTRKRRASNLTVQIGDEVQHVRSPPVSIPDGQVSAAPVGMPIDGGVAAESGEDSAIDSAGSNAFWQNDGEQDVVGELPIASHFSPITPFLPATSSNETEPGNTTAPGLAVEDERPTSAAGADEIIPPSPFSFLWSPAVGQVRFIPMRMMQYRAYYCLLSLFRPGQNESIRSAALFN